MQLGKTQKTNQFLESLKAEGEVIVEDVRPSVGLAKPAAAPLTDPVTLTVEEKINVTLKRDGGISNFVVQGTLSLQILNQEDAFIQVQVLSLSLSLSPSMLRLLGTSLMFSRPCQCPMSTILVVVPFYDKI